MKRLLGMVMATALVLSNVQGVYANVVYNEETDSYFSTDIEDGTIAINGSVYDAEDNFYGMLDTTKKYLENIVPTDDDSFLYDDKIKTKKLVGFDNTGKKIKFSENTYTYTYTPKNEYLVLKWDKTDKEDIDVLNVAIKIAGTDDFVAYGINLEPDKQYKVVSDFRDVDLEIFVTTNYKVKGKAVLELGSSNNKLAEYYDSYNSGHLPEYDNESIKNTRTVDYWTSFDVPKNIDGNQGRVANTIYNSLGGIASTFKDSDTSMDEINLSISREGSNYILASFMNMYIGERHYSHHLGEGHYDIRVSTNSNVNGKARIIH